jgi:hypothetical protein
VAGIRPSALAVFVEAGGGPPVSPVEMPSPSDVLYERGRGPEGKRCGNCALYAEASERCLLFGQATEVGAEMVCGHHASGPPQLYSSTLGGRQYADPTLAGLVRAPDGGAACRNCRHYSGVEGEWSGCCAAVYVDGRPAAVEALGRCARWRYAEAR